MFYHLNADVVSRGHGSSIVAAFAYVNGEKLRDSYNGKIYDRSYRQDVIHKEIILPPEAPREFLDRQTLLDALNASESRQDSQMARLIKVALPNELSFDEQVALINEFVMDNFININLCANIAIHEGVFDISRKPASIKAVHERKNNPHGHIIIPFRSVVEKGFHKTKTQTRYMNKTAYLIFLRKEWARLQNREFERLGLKVRVSHERLDAQGINREPTKHIGAAAMALEARGIQTDRGDEYRRTIERNREHEMERQLSRQIIRDYERAR